MGSDEVCYGVWSAAVSAAAVAAWMAYDAGLCCLEIGPGAGLEAVARLLEEAGVEGLSAVLSLVDESLCAAGLALSSLVSRAAKMQAGWRFA